MIRKIFLSLILPLFLFSQTNTQEPVKLIKPEDQENKQTEVVINNNSLKAVEKQTIEKTKETKSEEQKQIELQNKLLDSVIENINNESLLEASDNEKDYKKQLTLLSNKITINKRANNSLAVTRDELKVIYLKEKRLYEQTLKNIIKGKREFRERQYFVNLLENSIEKMKKTSLEKYEAIYEEHKDYSNYISEDLTKNYINVYNQRHTQVFVLEYLKENISKFRKSNFFVDEFNLKYFVKKIDEIQGVSFISNLTSYHFKFSIGELVVVIFIIAFFRLLNLKIISLLATFIAKVFVQRKNTKDEDDDTDEIRAYLKESINTPMIYALYLLAIQISIYILIKDPILIEKVIPWINTIYMALLTWGLYAILNNSINYYAQNLLEKYPNVRKEMIVFILRIIKIVLILLVILFLFSQLGIDIKAIAASLGVGGIAIALASKDTLTNFFGSLSIMTDNSFSQGDWIKSGDIEGTVVDIRMRTTRIRTFDNAMITVPNSQLANTHIMNWSKRRIGRRIQMKIGITYESKMDDIVQLREDIYEMLINHTGIATSKNAQLTSTRKFEAIKREDLQGVKRTLLVYIDEFGPSSVNILVYCFSRSPDWEEWLTVKEDVLVKISELTKKNNCEFAYPTQALWLKK
ncbi:mechanosensitive ion channel family protein [Arcobacter roscoffensis]|uniref:Mechanosensitive ion channel n=1 Tax=Arcobacter roscoffensis TaxID=2961520 RepID=A0ABY5E8V9_9BACT|nr:mechanosensitive ion channel domain-containing protein [Arcobacter roscoffensis]UTJ07211.1 mechanosensitive ion channel [Arcobacter roscoffensis]